MQYQTRGLENALYRSTWEITHYGGYNLFAFVTIDDIRRFEVRKDDVWVVTFPKSGTTWLQEIVYLVNSGLDFEGAKENIDTRFPYLEFTFPGMKAIADTPSPRYLKSHLPLPLLPDQVKEKKPKIIYLARNPKDNVVSFYNFSNKFIKFKESTFVGSFEDYCERFVDDRGYGPWWKHVIDGWDRRDEENVLFLTYEDMQSDIRGSIATIASFLGKTLSAKENEAIAAHCSFDSMKGNNSVNYNWFKGMGFANEDSHFMRKGKVGDWKNHLSEDIVARIDEMVKTKIEPSGLVLKETLEDSSDSSTPGTS